MTKPTFFDRLRILASELVLGTLIASLSVLTALSGYQSSMADSDQTKYNVQGQQMLTDANAEYLTANQLIVYDYTLYDGYYTADTEDKADYYQENFSEELQAAISTDAEDPFSDAYYDAVYLDANDMFDQADELFQLAEDFNQRGDALQLVMLFMALGLAFSAWASLLKEESNLRILFAVFSIAMLILGLVLYFGVPTVTV
jgi:hypothetical protein